MKRNLIFLGVASLGFAAMLALPAMTFAASAAATNAASTAKQPFYYGVWLPFWQSQNGASQIAVNLDELHEVSPFSYSVNDDGSLNDDLNIGNGSWAGWFSAVKEDGVKVIPTIAWFDGQGIYNLLSNTATRQAEENKIAALVKTQGFDGIDIDFESMLPVTRPYYSLFITGLAERLHPAGKVLTCTVQARTPPVDIYQTIPDSITYPENYPLLNQYCDEVRVMAYDQETTNLTLDAQKGNGTLYAPVADPDWVKEVLSDTLPYISAKKVMLGIPTYGYEYEVSWNGGITTYQRVRAFDYLDAMDRADNMNLTPTRNNSDEMGFTFASSTYIAEPPILVSTVYSTEPPELAAPVDPNASTTFFVTFPDATSILDEINVAKAYHLRGAMLFKADGDIDPAIWGEMH